MALTNEMNACYTEWLLALLSAFSILAYFNWTEYHVFKKIEKTHLGVLQQGRNRSDQLPFSLRSILRLGHLPCAAVFTEKE